MFVPDFSTIQLRLKQEENNTRVFDPVRKKWLVLTPEEHVRQYYLQYLIDVLKYPAALISVEKKIKVAGMDRRFDIIVYGANHSPWMLVECKAPDVPLSDKTLHQLLQYHNAMPCRYWVISNGHQNYCADANDILNIRWCSALPAYNG